MLLERAREALGARRLRKAAARQSVGLEDPDPVDLHDPAGDEPDPALFEEDD